MNDAEQPDESNTFHSLICQAVIIYIAIGANALSLLCAIIASIKRHYQRKGKKHTK
jgi:hypothetical protein